MKNIGLKIKERRKELGISQTELAEKLGIKKSTLSQYESGDINIPIQKLIILSTILEVTPNYFLGFENEMEVVGMSEKYEIYEKCLEKRIPVLIKTEADGDKYKDFIYPILKNNINDIIILDINGKAFSETERYRKLNLKSNIKKIDLFEEISDSFNPFSYLTLKNVYSFIDNLVANCLGVENKEKNNFLISVIAYLFFTNRLNKTNSEITFSMVYDFIEKMGTKENIVKEFEIMNTKKYFTDRTLFKNLGIIDITDNEEKNKIINLGFIPEYYYLNEKLIKLKEEKLTELKKDILLDLKIFTNEKVRTNTMKDEINISELREKNRIEPTTIYFIVDEEKINEIAPIVRMFYTIVFYENTLERTGLDYSKYSPKDKRQKGKFLVIIADDLHKFGNNITFEKVIGFVGGYGIKVFVISDEDKIKSIYGDKNCILANCQDIINLQKNKIEYYDYQLGIGRFKETYTKSNIIRKRIN